MSLSFREYIKPSQWKNHIHDLATVSPLIAGVIAPLSVLLDIPALTEKWYAQHGEPQPDPKASLILSGVGLGFSVLANAIMLRRFSEKNKRRRILILIPVSIAGWSVKVIASLVNLILFGILTRNKPSYSFLEGFWCAVISCITSVAVLFFLLLHWTYELRAQRAGIKDGVGSNRQVRVSGRHFMLSTTFFLALIAISALIFSRIEGWTYLEGIYFFVVTFLTVGFGDFSPTHTSTQILLFPLALLGIAALGSLLDVIIRFFSARSSNRKAAARARLERIWQADEDKRQDVADLHREMEFLEKLNSRQDVWDQAAEFALSFSGFLAFWLVGAAIFSVIEGWTYGFGLYFGYVFFLSIGYGDYSPMTPAGRVVFIVYSLLAVPIMAAFAIEAVSQIMTRASTWRLEKRRVDEGVEEAATEATKRAISHAEYVLKQRQRWDSHKKGQDTQAQRSSRSTVTGSEKGEVKEKVRAADAKEARLDEEEQEVQVSEQLNAKVMKELVQHAVALELHARRLLLQHLPAGSQAEILLKADRNVQLRDLRALLRGIGANEEADDLDAGTTGNGGDLSEKERTEKRKKAVERLGLGDAAAQDADWVSPPMSDEEVMEELRQYRESFAGLLVAGSVLQQLEGNEMLMLERRREEHKASK